MQTVMAAFPWLHELSSRSLDQLCTEVRYGGYLARQQADIRAFQQEEGIELTGVPFDKIGGLSAEVRSKLTSLRPGSLGAASRIQGITPAALAAIVAYVRKNRAAVASFT